MLVECRVQVIQKGMTLRLGLLNSDRHAKRPRINTLKFFRRNNFSLRKSKYLMS